MSTAVLTVKIPGGVHMRVAAAIVENAKKYVSSIFIKRKKTKSEQPGTKDVVADARSITEIVLLGAVEGTKICIEADGVDEKNALKALADIVAGVK